MANQLLRGRLFNPGDTVNADDLNNLVDLATALPAIISAHDPVVTPAGADEVLILKGGALKSARIDAIPNGVTSVGVTMPTAEFTITGTNPVTTTGTIAVGWKSGGFSANKVLAAPSSGGAGAPSFRLLTPADVSPLHQDIALATIDWSLGNVFAKVMTGNHTFSFTNVRDGQSIKVRLQYPHTGGPYFAHWDPGILWRGGADPGITTSPDAKDIYSFTAIGSSVYGYSDKNFS